MKNTPKEKGDNPGKGSGRKPAPAGEVFARRPIKGSARKSKKERAKIAKEIENRVFNKAGQRNK